MVGTSDFKCIKLLATKNAFTAAIINANVTPTVIPTVKLLASTVMTVKINRMTKTPIYLATSFLCARACGSRHDGGYPGRLKLDIAAPIKGNRLGFYRQVLLPL